MKTHIEYDDFGEYLEGFIDGELVVVEEKKTVEVIVIVQIQRNDFFISLAEPFNHVLCSGHDAI